MSSEEQNEVTELTLKLHKILIYYYISIQYTHSIRTDSCDKKQTSFKWCVYTIPDLAHTSWSQRCDAYLQKWAIVSGIRSRKVKSCYTPSHWCVCLLPWSYVQYVYAEILHINTVWVQHDSLRHIPSHEYILSFSV